MKRLTILGSTGSIGTQTLDVCRCLGYEVVALSAHTNLTLLQQQAREFHPRYVIITDEDTFRAAKTAFVDCNVKLLYGMEGLCEAASLPENDIVVNALVGMRGLRPTLSAIAAGKDVALANKETLVAGGKLVMEQAAAAGVTIYPVDSEHSAIFQCLQGNQHQQVRRLILTASGGPFFGKTREELAQVTVAQALKHPNWSMGAKITIDSASLMNKGLELIEAMWLFDMPPEKIDIVVHRQSVIHSMVEYDDRSVIAQLGAPDMRVPIQYALTWPDRFVSPAQPLSLLDCGPLTFDRPDPETFVCLGACMEAARRGGLAPCTANAANEEAVARFLAGQIGFLQIGEVVSAAMDSCGGGDYTNLDEVLEADAQARAFVSHYFDHTAR